VSQEEQVDGQIDAFYKYIYLKIKGVFFLILLSGIGNGLFEKS
jgi:hypothetical protein